jgi:hypothetical protein
MVPFTRILTVLMFAVLCFALIVPMALQRHNVMLAGGISIIFVFYLIANVILWRRMKPPA